MHNFSEYPVDGMINDFSRIFMDIIVLQLLIYYTDHTVTRVCVIQVLDLTKVQICIKWEAWGNSVKINFKAILSCLFY